MARDARLRLLQNVGEIGDGQFGLGQQRKDAQARVLARRLQRRVECIESEPRVSHIRHIKISLYGGKQSRPEIW